VTADPAYHACLRVSTANPHPGAANCLACWDGTRRLRQFQENKIKIYFINFYFIFESGTARRTPGRRQPAKRKTIGRTLRILTDTPLDLYPL
jgi:hypothetical protein